MGMCLLLNCSRFFASRDRSISHCISLFLFISLRQQAGNFDRVFINADLKSCFEDMVGVFKEWYPHLIEVEYAPDDEQKNSRKSKVHKKTKKKVILNLID